MDVRGTSLADRARKAPAVDILGSISPAENQHRRYLFERLLLVEITTLSNIESSRIVGTFSASCGSGIVGGRNSWGFQFRLGVVDYGRSMRFQKSIVIFSHSPNHETRIEFSICKRARFVHRALHL